MLVLYRGVKYPFNAQFSYNNIIILVVTNTIPTNKVTLIIKQS